MYVVSWTIVVCNFLLVGTLLGTTGEIVPTGTEIEGKHPIHYSEHQLRNLIIEVNKELLLLKRNFIKDVELNYIRIKQDKGNGFSRAIKGSTFGLAMTLMSEEFAELLVRKHIIQRRLSSGLRVLLHKLLPLRTLKYLLEKYPNSYNWLKKAEQVDLRSKFSNISNNEFIQLYKIIELRARLRAHDDVVALTDNNIKRIFKVIKWFLIDEKAAKDIKPVQLNAMSFYAQKILAYYTKEVTERERAIQTEFMQYLQQVGENVIKSIGDEKEFLAFIDDLIDRDGLDIDLSQEATTMDLPPTINEAMIENIRKKWIPHELLNSMTEDRKVLLQAKLGIKNFVDVDEQNLDGVDNTEWCSKVSHYLSKQSFDDD